MTNFHFHTYKTIRTDTFKSTGQYHPLSGTPRYRGGKYLLFITVTQRCTKCGKIKREQFQGYLSNIEDGKS